MRYKGVKIPTYEEAINEMALNNLNDDPVLGEKLVVEVREVNVIVCTKEEAKSIREMDGVNGINKKIEEVCKDYIDNVMDGALTMIDSVKDMEDNVNAPDSGKCFKDLRGPSPSNQPVKDVTPDNIKEGETSNENTETDSQDDKKDDSEECESEDSEGEQSPEECRSDREDGSGSAESGGEESREDEENWNILEEKETSSGVTLTDEQVDKLNKIVEEANKNNPEIQKIQSLPSNNGVEERKQEDITESGEKKLMNVSIDPNTGEHKILGDTDEIDDETFEEMYERISNSDIEFDRTDMEISEEEAERIASTDKNKLVSGFISDNDLDNISVDTIKDLIRIANRKIHKENFSVYNELPKDIKDLIDKYAAESGILPMDKRYRDIKHSVADMLVDDFISNVNMERIQHDFNSELETMFNKASEEIGEEIVGYSQEKIARYREAADKMEDPEKKEKLLKVLDNIDEAYNLKNLKEFAKTCKIKRFDLEKPSNYYERYTHKYAESNYNIYSIDMARPVLYRNLNDGEEEFSDKDINAFFIAFCKQTRNMKAEDVLDHAYMYYVIYNIVLADLNKSEKTRAVSTTFLNNVKEVIKNLRKRNPGVL